MWFKRKPRNRRLGRDHVLDVKLRSSQVRAVRSRRLALVLGSLFAVIFGFYLACRVGGWTLDELVYENKAFALQELDVQSDGVISTDQLRRWAGVKLEENLLALDLARVKRDLELVPVIQSASIERILPHTLRIRVVEREPIAQINVLRPRGNSGPEMVAYLVDAAGWVMLPLDPHQRTVPLSNQPADQLPLLHGLDPTRVQPGRRIEASQVQAALQLVVAFEQSPMAGLVELKSIDVSARDTLLVTTGQGSEVTFGLNDLEQQLRRWHSIADMGQRLSKVIATLDLAVNDNVPVRWLEASTLPPETPKPPKSSRTRKKHV
jgi:cell division septal protein FtsQ